MTQLTQQKTTIKSFFDQDNVKTKFKELMGKKSTAFITSVLQIAASNDLLKNAEPLSLFNAAAVAATLNLPLNNSLGLAYIVPYNEKQKDGSYMVKAQFQIGAKGFKQLAIRSGQFRLINEADVREGEIRNHNRLTGELTIDTIQDQTERQSKRVIGYVSYFKLLNGFENFYYLSVEEIEAHAKKYSQTYKKGFGVWKDDFNAMALKTVSKLNLSKNAPLSIEMEQAITFDQAIINDIETGDYQHVDNIPTNSNISVDIDKEEEKIVLLIQDCESISELEKLREYTSGNENILKAFQEKGQELTKEKSDK